MSRKIERNVSRRDVIEEKSETVAKTLVIANTHIYQIEFSLIETSEIQFHFQKHFMKKFNIHFGLKCITCQHADKNC